MYLRLSPYREILQGVLTDLEVNEGIIKITGKSGAGKTALCSQLYQELERKGRQPEARYIGQFYQDTDSLAACEYQGAQTARVDF